MGVEILSVGTSRVRLVERGGEPESGSCTDELQALLDWGGWALGTEKAICVHWNLMCSNVCQKGFDASVANTLWYLSSVTAYRSGRSESKRARGLWSRTVPLTCSSEEHNAR